MSAATLSALINGLAVLVMAAFTLTSTKLIGEVTVVMNVSSDEFNLDELVLDDTKELHLDVESAQNELDLASSEDSLQLPLTTEAPEGIAQLFGTKHGFASSNLSDFEGSLFGGRTGATKSELLEQYGGTVETEQAVENALEWLAKHQADNGSWNFNHMVDNRRKKCKCPASGMIGDCRTGATAMALLPFLGAGHTHQKGAHQATVEKGLYFLTSHLVVDGDKGGSLAQGGGNMYAHGMAAIALCEAYAMTQDRGLREPAQQALNYTVYAQADDGGWRYTPKQPGDTSAVGWQLMALKSGQMGYLDVPDSAFIQAGKFLDGVSAQQGALYGYTSPGEQKGTTAVGLLSRMYTGWGKDHPPLLKGALHLSTWGPSKNSMYYNYYATQVMRHLHDPEEWPKWNVAMRSQLVESQERDEEKHTFGSWYFPNDEHAKVGGRLYCTSLATMTLEVYYRHLPLYRKDAVTSHQP